MTRSDPETARQLDIVERSLREGVDDLTIINRMRAARGEPPLTELDFEKFDAHMRDPNAGPLIL